MNARYTFLSTNSEIVKVGPSISNILQSLSNPTSSDPVWITANISNTTQAFLAYKNDIYVPFQSIQMYDDGTHNDGVSGDGVYGAMLPANSPTTKVCYYIYAENNDAGKIGRVHV